MKRVIFILTVLLLALTVVVVNIFFRATRQPAITPVAPTPTPVTEVPVRFDSLDYSRVFSDPQIAQAVKETLKNSSESARQGDYVVISFPTEVDQRPNLVYEKDNIAQYILQERTSDNADLTAFLTTHTGSKSFTLYDTSHAGVGFSWYIFPADGIAFLANKDLGYAIKVLYFPATTQEEFIKTTAVIFHLTQKDPSSIDTPEGFQ